MKHLYIVVEGETELEFVNKLLIPYFYAKNLNTYIQGLKITMRGGGNGFNNMEHLKREIKPLIFNENKPIITTMIDYYGINSEKKMPNYSQYMLEIDTNKRIELMEKEINTQVQNIQPYPFFIPNILKHEMETLFFANPESFEIESNPKIKEKVFEIYNQYADIENINYTPQGAPSKRLIKIYEECGEKYQKITNGIDIALLTGIDEILNKCKRFKKWIDKIINIMQTT